MVAAGGGDACPSCGTQMAADQRYCLNCGARRGDPRLPFMDAVVFMDAMRQPQVAAPAPARPRRRGPSPNATLVAGVATLVLAIGVGVLIGRSGDSNTPVANTSPQVIKVEGGGTGAATASTAGKAKKSAGKSSAGSGKSKKQAEAKVETGSSGTSKAAEEVLKPSGDVKMAPPKAQVGEKCEKGTAGCGENGEFNGSFFE
jgi:hypothetical protein